MIFWNMRDTLSKVFRYLTRVLVAISVLINVLIFFGPSNQTFSARNYDWKKRGKPNLVRIIDTIFWFDPHHCQMSWVYWRSRKDVMEEFKLQKKAEKEGLQEDLYRVYYYQEW